MFFLPWWIYVLIGTVSFTCALLGQWLANIAEPGIKQDDGPFPCGEYLGMDEEGTDDWCWQVAGHDCEHVGMRQEWPGVSPLPIVMRQPNETHDVTVYEDQDEVLLPAPGVWQSLPETGDSFTTLHNETIRQADAAGNVVVDESPGYLPDSAPFQHND